MSTKWVDCRKCGTSMLVQEDEPETGLVCNDCFAGIFKDIMTDAPEHNDCPKCLIQQETIRELRELVWMHDIPHPTCPEYREHHESIQKILKFIDKNLLSDDNE